MRRSLSIACRNKERRGFIWPTLGRFFRGYEMVIPFLAGFDEEGPILPKVLTGSLVSNELPNNAWPRALDLLFHFFFLHAALFYPTTLLLSLLTFLYSCSSQVVYSISNGIRIIGLFFCFSFPQLSHCLVRLQPQTLFLVSHTNSTNPL